MKRHAWILVLLLSAVPSFAQDTDDTARDMRIGGIYSAGNLAVREIDRGSGPVQQLRVFFLNAGKPLSLNQEQEIEAIVLAQQSAVEATDHSPEAVRRVNSDHFRRVIAVFNNDQRAAWEKYRNEEIKNRGGYLALKLILAEAGSPLNADQQKTIRAIFGNIYASRDNSGTLAAKSMMLEKEEFKKVVDLLDANQRKALQASKHTLLATKNKNQ